MARNINISKFRKSMPIFTYPEPEDRIFNRLISGNSVLLGETALTISHSIETDSPVETEIVRVVSLSTTEIPEITRLKTIFRVPIP